MRKTKEELKKEREEREAQRKFELREANRKWLIGELRKYGWTHPSVDSEYEEVLTQILKDLLETKRLLKEETRTKEFYAAKTSTTEAELRGMKTVLDSLKSENKSPYWPYGFKQI